MENQKDSNAPLTLLVKIFAKPEKADQVKEALLGLLAPTRAEDGCECYHFHIADDNPALFVFVETWKTRKHWEAHNESAHLAEFLKITDETVDEFDILEMTEYGQ